jgi:Domain of unknown function (DUF4402)
VRPATLFLPFLCVLLSAAGPPCQLCAPSERAGAQEAPRAPIRIEVEAALDFSRIARTGGDGEVRVDAASGTRTIAGGVVDLGGMGLRGEARVTGQPFAPVLITLPNRVQLRSSTGDLAEVIDIRSDLSRSPTLDSDGNLHFSFGGRLILRGTGAGIFRGSIPISADYP